MANAALNVQWEMVTDAKAKTSAIDAIKEHISPLTRKEAETFRPIGVTRENDDENINPARPEHFGDLDTEEIYAFNAQKIVIEALKAAEKGLKDIVGLGLDEGVDYSYVDGIEDATVSVLTKLFNHVPSAHMELERQLTGSHSMAVSGMWYTTGKALREAGFTIADGKATPPALKPEAP